MAKAAKITMDDLLKDNEESFKKAIAGDTVQGTVLSVKKLEILIDLGSQGVGLVPRREASFSKNLSFLIYSSSLRIFLNIMPFN